MPRLIMVRYLRARDKDCYQKLGVISNGTGTERDAGSKITMSLLKWNSKKERERGKNIHDVTNHGNSLTKIRMLIITKY